MTNAGWQVTNGGWGMGDDKCRMGDDKCRDETGQPRFPGAKKWVAPAATLVPEGGERVASGDWNRRGRYGTVRKASEQSQLLGC